MYVHIIKFCSCDPEKVFIAYFDRMKADCKINYVKRFCNKCMYVHIKSCLYDLENFLADRKVCSTVGTV